MKITLALSSTLHHHHYNLFAKPLSTSTEDKKPCKHSISPLIFNSSSKFAQIGFCENSVWIRSERNLAARTSRLYGLQLKHFSKFGPSVVTRCSQLDSSKTVSQSGIVETLSTSPWCLLQRQWILFNITLNMIYHLWTETATIEQPYDKKKKKESWVLISGCQLLHIYCI